LQDRVGEKTPKSGTFVQHSKGGEAFAPLITDPGEEAQVVLVMRDADSEINDHHSG